MSGTEPTPPRRRRRSPVRDAARGIGIVVAAAAAVLAVGWLLSLAVALLF